jgi:hypothetical protein
LNTNKSSSSTSSSSTWSFERFEHWSSTSLCLGRQSVDWRCSAAALTAQRRDSHEIQHHVRTSGRQGEREGALYEHQCFLSVPCIIIGHLTPKTQKYFYIFFFFHTKNIKVFLTHNHLTAYIWFLWPLRQS